MNTWFERIRQPLCAHAWEVIGHLIDRRAGYRVVIRCPQCGARQQVPPRAQLAAPAERILDPRHEA